MAAPSLRAHHQPGHTRGLERTVTFYIAIIWRYSLHEVSQHNALLYLGQLVE
jgi:hypothetical protein